MTDEISSLVGFSQQRATLRPQSVDVVDVIQRAVQTVKVLRDFQTLSIGYVGVEEYQGWFDSGKLERIILNLLFNACEVVSAHTGTVSVDCRPNKQGVEIRVEDNGPGITESIRETLFEPFVSYGKEKGIGLGLTVVQRLVQEHGGEVSIERTGPEGTVFLVYVPSQPPHELSRILTHLERPGKGAAL
jgi:signal transduction histidine kinase